MEEKKKAEPFKLPTDLKDKIEVKMPHIICFHYHGRKVDLRTCSAEQLLKMAADKSCGVLQLKETIAAGKAAAPKAAEASPVAAAETAAASAPSSGGGSSDKDSGKSTGKK